MSTVARSVQGVGPMLLLLYLLHLVPQAAVDPPTCLTEDGKTACGFHCVAAHGTVACAQSPSGTCTSVGERATCWDSPQAIRIQYRRPMPVAQCLARAGNIACGYNCAARDNQVACASTPDGICVAGRLGITCWDPSETVYCADRRRPLPRPQCVVSDGEVACGYGCKKHAGSVACAQTPSGTCTIAQDRLVCLDPEQPCDQP